MCVFKHSKSERRAGNKANRGGEQRSVHAQRQPPQAPGDDQAQNLVNSPSGRDPMRQPPAERRWHAAPCRMAWLQLRWSLLGAGETVGRAGRQEAPLSFLSNQAQGRPWAPRGGRGPPSLLLREAASASEIGELTSVHLVTNSYIPEHLPCPWCGGTASSKPARITAPGG